MRDRSRKSSPSASSANAASQKQQSWALAARKLTMPIFWLRCSARRPPKEYKDMREQTISKVLSANGTGGTGGHQAGLLIPREKRILEFFPKLDGSRLNPRAHLRFEDQSGHFWEFAFIYYNNRFYGG